MVGRSFDSTVRSSGSHRTSRLSLSTDISERGPRSLHSRPEPINHTALPEAWRSRAASSAAFNFSMAKRLPAVMAIDLEAMAFVAAEAQADEKLGICPFGSALVPSNGADL